MQFLGPKMLSKIFLLLLVANYNLAAATFTLDDLLYLDPFYSWMYKSRPQINPTPEPIEENFTPTPVVPDPEPTDPVPNITPKPEVPEPVKPVENPGPVVNPTPCPQCTQKTLTALESVALKLAQLGNLDMEHFPKYPIYTEDFNLDGNFVSVNPPKPPNK